MLFILGGVFGSDNLPPRHGEADSRTTEIAFVRHTGEKHRTTVVFEDTPT